MCTQLLRGSGQGIGRRTLMTFPQEHKHGEQQQLEESRGLEFNPYSASMVLVCFCNTVEAHPFKKESSSKLGAYRRIHGGQGDHLGMVPVTLKSQLVPPRLPI